MRGQSAADEYVDEDGEVHRGGEAPREPERPAPGFEGVALTMGQETAVAAVAAKAQAMIQARYVMALQRPRNLATTRTKLLELCAGSSFAETAWYKRPVGKAKNDETGEWEEKFAEGLSIRFAESAAREMRNIACETMVTYDGRDRRVINVCVTDLEANLPYSEDISIDKTVERRKLGRNQKPLAVRENSYGDMVYIVQATDSQVDVKASAEVSKTLRDLILRVVPGDIKAECRDKIAETRKLEIRRDPAAARKKVIDAFAAIGVMPDALELYLGHEVASCSPPEIEHLRDLYVAIKDGVTTWADIARTRAAEDEGDEKAAGKVEQLKDRVKRHADKVKAKAQPAPQPAADAKPETRQPAPATEEHGRQADGDLFDGPKK